MSNGGSTVAVPREGRAAEGAGGNCAKPWLSRRAATGALAALGAAFAALHAWHWNLGYLDFGDGNYMYISWRLSEGVRLYSEILAPQPPLHLVLGSSVATAARLLRLPEPLYIFRCLTLLLNLATMVLVYRAARAAATGWWAGAASSHARLGGLVAAAVFLAAPIGFWWRIGYQSQPLVVLCLLGQFVLLQRQRWAAGGAAGALAALTNMTAVPYLAVTALALAVARPWRAAGRWAAALGATLAAGVGAAQWATGAYYENVIVNQVGAFPKHDPLGYALGKINAQGLETLRLEGGYIAVALGAAAVWALAATGRRARPSAGAQWRRLWTLWFSAASFGAIVFVAKGGTMNYVFTLTEPYMALLWGVGAAGAAAAMGARAAAGGDAASTEGRVARALRLTLGAGAALLALGAVTGVGALHSCATLQQRTFELPAYETVRIRNEIRRYAPNADDAIISPPHYAFLAGRPLAREYSEYLLWGLKYAHEREAGQRGRAVELFEGLAADLAAKKIKYVALETGQAGRIPEVRAALDKYYARIRPEGTRTLNTLLEFYRPKD